MFQTSGSTTAAARDGGQPAGKRMCSHMCKRVRGVWRRTGTREVEWGRDRFAVHAFRRDPRWSLHCLGSLALTLRFLARLTRFCTSKVLLVDALSSGTSQVDVSVMQIYNDQVQLALPVLLYSLRTNARLLLLFLKCIQPKQHRSLTFVLAAARPICC